MPGNSMCLFKVAEGYPCQKSRTWGFPGGKRKYCGVHKSEGMINIHNAKKPRCQAPGCDTNPTFGIAGLDRKARFCGRHKEPRMVDITKRTCEVLKCNTIPCFGVLGGKARFCLKHSIEGMANVRNIQCAVTGCKKRRVDAKTISFCKGHQDPRSRPKVRRRTRRKSKATMASSEADSTAVGAGQSSSSSPVSSVGVKRTREGHPRDPEAFPSGESLMAFQGAQGELVSDVHDDNDSPERAAGGVLAGDGSDPGFSVFLPISTDEVDLQEMAETFVADETLEFPPAVDDASSSGTITTWNVPSAPISAAGAGSDPSAAFGIISFSVLDLESMERVFTEANVLFGDAPYDDPCNVFYGDLAGAASLPASLTEVEGSGSMA